jgi:transcriptional regulator with XRE-family HTH domain
MNDRLVKIMKELEINDVILGDITLYDPAAIRRFVSGKKSMDVKFIEKLLEVIPGINEDYLLKGVGDILNEDVDLQDVLESHRKYSEEKMKRGVFPEVCDRVRVVRIHLNLSQGELAKEIKAERHTVAGIENYRQNPSPAFSGLLRKKYKIDLNWLFTGEGKMISGNEVEDNTKELSQRIDELQSINKSLLRLIDLTQ